MSESQPFLVKSDSRIRTKIASVFWAMMAVVSICFIWLIFAIMMPAFSKSKALAHRAVCRTNLRELGVALIVYAKDYEKPLSFADNWSDVLLKDADISPKLFLCPGDDASEGKSSYAINHNAASQRFREIPPDMVLLFEVSPGPRRWNPSGGPESLTTEYHQGEGCNVLFADGSVQFVPANQLHTLRWTPD